MAANLSQCPPKLRILAIDPGGTTGFSSNWVHPNTWQVKFESAREFRDYLYQVGKPHDVIIAERFDHRQKSKIEHAAIEQIGIIKLFADEHPSKTMVWQGSEVKSRKKTFFDDKKLKIMGLWQPYDDDHKHGQDALRHRLMYELRHNMIDLTIFKSLS